MGVVEKYLPTLNSKGDRELDKIKARLCVDGRAQVREDYAQYEIESPTASIASIFTIAQIAAAENRFIMVGDIGTAYLNARMPMDKPDKILHMVIAKDVADEIIRQDKSFERYRKQDGGLLVRLEKALYGCIESANLWYQNLAGTLQNNGFTANPRDLCVFNKIIRKVQFTILVYVDDLKMTCVDKAAVLEMEQILRNTYGQFRTTHGRILPYLGCTWDYTEPGFVKVLQTGMIQDLIQARQKTHKDRGTVLTGNPNSPGAPHLFNRTPDCERLSAEQAKINHTQVAILNYLANHGRPDMALVTGELCKRVKDPTTQDFNKLDRGVLYLHGTLNQPLRLGCTMPPKVTVSIDAAFANRDMMKSTSGMCVTLGVGNFITSSKVQKLNSKSSTEAEIIAVSDGMNIPLWLVDFLFHQGYKKYPIRLEQDNQSCIALLTKGRSTAETTRFIEIRKFWITDYIRTGAVEIVYVPTEDMTSDYFTKPLQGAVFSKMVKKIMGN
jgi:Reverse transcriptase (RNA-dependent DNA polymerase)